MLIVTTELNDTEFVLLSPIDEWRGPNLLAKAGNAVDAAVAANAATGLMAPMANGIGGDLFATVYAAA
jgi:gamma-glutamyltranspeptidase/glutathione hydrolase